MAPDYEKYIVANSSSCGILLLADHIAPYLSYKADAYNYICTSEVLVLNLRYSDVQCGLEIISPMSQADSVNELRMCNNRKDKGNN